MSDSIISAVTQFFTEGVVSSQLAAVPLLTERFHPDFPLRGGEMPPRNVAFFYNPYSGGHRGQALYQKFLHLFAKEKPAGWNLREVDHTDASLIWQEKDSVFPVGEYLSKNPTKNFFPIKSKKDPAVRLRRLRTLLDLLRQHGQGEICLDVTGGDTSLMNGAESIYRAAGYLPEQLFHTEDLSGVQYKLRENKIFLRANGGGTAGDLARLMGYKKGRSVIDSHKRLVEAKMPMSVARLTLDNGTVHYALEPHTALLSDTIGLVFERADRKKWESPLKGSPLLYFSEVARIVFEKYSPFHPDPHQPFQIKLEAQGQTHQFPNTMALLTTGLHKFAAAIHSSVTPLNGQGGAVLSDSIPGTLAVVFEGLAKGLANLLTRDMAFPATGTNSMRALDPDRQFVLQNPGDRLAATFQDPVSGEPKAVRCVLNGEFLEAGKVLKYEKRVLPAMDVLVDADSLLAKQCDPARSSPKVRNTVFGGLAGFFAMETLSFFGGDSAWVSGGMMAFGGAMTWLAPHASLAGMALSPLALGAILATRYYLGPETEENQGTGAVAHYGSALAAFGATEVGIRAFAGNTAFHGLMSGRLLSTGRARGLGLALTGLMAWMHTLSGEKEGATA